MSWDEVWDGLIKTTICSRLLVLRRRRKPFDDQNKIIF